MRYNSDSHDPEAYGMDARPARGPVSADLAARLPDYLKPSRKPEPKPARREMEAAE